MTHHAHKRQEPLSATGIFLLALLLTGFTVGLYMLTHAMQTDHFFDGDPTRASMISTHAMVA